MHTVKNGGGVKFTLTAHEHLGRTPIFIFRHRLTTYASISLKPMKFRYKNFSHNVALNVSYTPRYLIMVPMIKPSGTRARRGN